MLQGGYKANKLNCIVEVGGWEPKSFDVKRTKFSLSKKKNGKQKKVRINTSIYLLSKHHVLRKESVLNC